MYNDYSNNYKSALQIYNHYTAESEKFRETLAVRRPSRPPPPPQTSHNTQKNKHSHSPFNIQLCKATCKPPLNLESFLINPIQRIPRYNLLLDVSILHASPSESLQYLGGGR